MVKAERSKNKKQENKYMKLTKNSLPSDACEYRVS